MGLFSTCRDVPYPTSLVCGSLPSLSVACRLCVLSFFDVVWCSVSPAKLCGRLPFPMLAVVYVDESLVSGRGVSKLTLMPAPLVRLFAPQPVHVEEIPKDSEFAGSDLDDVDEDDVVVVSKHKTKRGTFACCLLGVSMEEMWPSLPGVFSISVSFLPTRLSTCRSVCLLDVFPLSCRSALPPLVFLPGGPPCQGLPSSPRRLRGTPCDRPSYLRLRVLVAAAVVPS